MKIEWTRVTWYSKLVAVILFVVVFWSGIYLGRQFPEKSYQTNQPLVTQPSQSVKAQSITIQSPVENQLVTSPLTIKGLARGSWYFEASFPIKLVDANGKILAQTPAQAKGDWMTNDFVPFETVLNFESPNTVTGKLIFSKDNPSGLPQNDETKEISVKF